jgi:hypothetical protein
MGPMRVSQVEPEIAIRRANEKASRSCSSIDFERLVWSWESRGTGATGVRSGSSVIGELNHPAFAESHQVGEKGT